VIVLNLDMTGVLTPLPPLCGFVCDQYVRALNIPMRPMSTGRHLQGIG
jgi:hypothetical protein